MEPIRIKQENEATIIITRAGNYGLDVTTRNDDGGIDQWIQVERDSIPALRAALELIEKGETNGH